MRHVFASLALLAILHSSAALGQDAADDLATLQQRIKLLEAKLEAASLRIEQLEKRLVGLMARDRDSSTGAAADVPRRYARFQGEWTVVAQETVEGSESKVPEIVVKVSGTRFELSGSGASKDWGGLLEFSTPAAPEDNPYRALRERGAKGLDDIVDVENQISVFWFVGIYKWSGDELHLALKYCGQGVEGDRFRDFRPPSSFDQKPMDGEVRVTLKRKPR